MSNYQAPATLEEEKSQLARAIEASKREMGSRAKPSHLYDRAAMVSEWEERFGTKIFREGSEQEFARWWAFKKGEPFESAGEEKRKEKVKGDEPAAESVTRKRKAGARAAAKKTKRTKRS